MTSSVVIVGGGPAGIFTAYELIKNRHYNGTLTIIEMGKGTESRVCPKVVTKECVHCSTCAITSGIGGSGAWSDSKLSLSTEVGGELPSLLGESLVQDLIKQVETIYADFGAEPETFEDAETEEIKQLRRKAITAGLKLVTNPVKHLGTEKSQELYERLESFLRESSVNIRTNVSCTDLIVDPLDKGCKGIVLDTGEQLFADKVILAPGRRGASWLENLCSRYGIKCYPGTVDIGVRVECRNEVMEKINRCLYEGKFIGYPAPFRDKVRTFCQNPGGFVTQENYDNNLALVNGHAYRDTKSNNTNLSILVSHNFAVPFNQPIKYAQKVGELTNMLANGNILVQRYGDILAGKRTWQKELSRSNVVPTLPDAVAGDITAAMPYRTMTDIIAFIQALDKVVPGFAAEETLLYSPEIKFYSNRVEMDKDLRTGLKNLYCLGDGSGWTRGLMMASCMGIYCASQIMR